MDQQTSKSTAEAFEYLQRQIPSGLQSPTIGIICGSGLGGLADAVQPHPRYEVSYHDIPHFPISQGKKGRGGSSPS